MLQTMLDSHSKIRCFGEIFNPQEVEYQKPENWPSGCKTQNDILRDAWLFPAKPVVGFILHDDCEAVSSAFPFDIYPHRSLIPLSDVRLVWMERRNKLAQFISEQIARLTGVWNIPNPSYRPAVKPISVDPRVADGWIRRTLGDRNAFRTMLKDHEGISITYEDLCGDQEHTQNKVVDFLGVGRESLKPKTCRVSTYKHISELVINYAQIRKVFSEFGLE